MPSQLVLEKANKVLAHVSPEPDGTKSIDPFTIITLILGLIKMFKECRDKPAQGAQAARNPGLFHRMQVKRYVKRSMDRDTFRRKGDEIIRGIFALGQDATENDIKQLIEEADNNE